MSFDAELAASIVSRVSEGQSLRSACVDLGTSHSTFLLWCSKDRTLADQYARARETGTDVEFEALDALQQSQPERDDKGRVDPGWVAWKRLQVDTKKWELSKKAPKKYGEKVDMNVNARVAFDRIECVVIDPEAQA